MVSTHLAVPYASYSNAEGVTEYSQRTLEGNWQEERARKEAGEKPADREDFLNIMNGAYRRALDDDNDEVWPPIEMPISTAPPTRDAVYASNFALEGTIRMARSRVALASERVIHGDPSTTLQANTRDASGRFKEYSSINHTFMPALVQRPNQPICYDAYYHSTWGGPIQYDGRSKTRFSSENLQKIAQRQPAMIPDGDFASSQKLISGKTLHHIFSERPSETSHMTGDFGCVVPHNPPPAITETDRLMTTSRSASSWLKNAGM